jgi:hypothetical protein
MANPWEEYQQAASPGPWVEYDQRKPAAQRVNTADGMGAGEKLLVGIGSSMNKAYEGLTDPFVGEQTRSSRKADRDLYAKNKGDLGGWGTAGEVAGDIASYAPLALVPGGLPAQMGAAAAASGAMTPGSPQERAQAAAMGAGGAGVGNVLTRTLGRVFKPIGEKAADTVAQEARGILPTFGQGMAAKEGGVGRAIGRAEEGAMSVPMASGPLRNTRRGVQDQWQQAVRNEAAAPGRQGVESVDALRKGYNDAYTSTLDSVPLPYASVQYAPDLRQLSQGLPVTQAQRDTVAKVFDEIRLKHMQNPTPGVQVTAAGAHGAESDMKALARRYSSSQDPAQQDLGRLFGNVADEYGQAWRAALPSDVRTEIAAIDRAYPGFVAVRTAAKNAATAASEGDPNKFSPAVLARAARTTDRTPNKTTYIAGDAPMQEMARLGQGLQGKVPDSGTTERMLGGGALLGAGALGHLPAALAGGGALAAYGTRPVQNYFMGRASPAAQQAMLDALRRAAPYGAAVGASQFAD